MIIAIGAGLVLTIGAAALAAPGPSTDAATTTQPPSGPEWCGFKDQLGSRVRCGYSSENDCKQAVGEPGAICIVDPYLT